MSDAACGPGASAFDFDLLGFARFAPRQGDREDAVGVARLDLVGIHGKRQSDGARESAVPSLVAAESLAFLERLGFARAAERQHFPLDRKIEIRGLHAGQLVKQVAKVVGGSGGGRPTLAQAGGRDADRIEEALSLVTDLVREGLS